MTTENQVMELFERANPVPDSDAVDVVLGADRYLEALLDKSSTMTMIDTTSTPEQPGQRRWIWSAIAAATALVVVAAGIVIISRDDTTPADTPTPTTPVPTTTTPTPTTTDAGVEPPAASDMAVVDAFFAAYNDGDTDGVLAIVSPDVLVTETYDGGLPNPDNEPSEDWDLRLAWNHGQGEVLTEPTCGLVAEQPAPGAALDCEYDTLDAVVQAVFGSPIPTRTWFTIVDGAITEIHQGYGSPDFAHFGGLFGDWMDLHHPEVTGAGFSDRASRDEAVERGRLRAQWAQEWARFLDDNDCSYLVVCTPTEAVVDTEAAVVPAPPLPAPTSGSTQATVVGDITWTFVEGDETTQPERVATSIGGEFLGRDFDGRGWSSPDGITWERGGTVDDVGIGVVVGDETWATVHDRESRTAELVRLDGGEVRPVDLPESTAPSLEGLQDFEVGLRTSRLGDSLVVHRSTHYLVQWDEFYDVGVAGWDMIVTYVLKTNRFRLKNPGGGGSRSATLDLELLQSDPVQIELRDVPSGEFVTTLEAPAGMSYADFLTRFVSGLHHNELLIGGADGFRPLSFPWPNDFIATMSTFDERLFVLRRPPNPDLTSATRFADAQLWSSADGDSWDRHPLPTPTGSTIDSVQFTGGERGAIVTIVSSDDEEYLDSWFTNDAKTWIPVNAAATRCCGVFDADFGWLIRHDELFEEVPDGTNNEESYSVSPDGLTWQQISIEFPETTGGTSGSFGTIGNTIFATKNTDQGERYMWVGSVDTG